MGLSAARWSVFTTVSAMLIGLVSIAPPVAAASPSAALVETGTPAAAVTARADGPAARMSAPVAVLAGSARAACQAVALSTFGAAQPQAGSSADETDRPCFTFTAVTGTVIDVMISGVAGDTGVQYAISGADCQGSAYANSLCKMSAGGSHTLTVTPNGPLEFELVVYQVNPSGCPSVSGLGWKSPVLSGTIADSNSAQCRTVGLTAGQALRVWMGADPSAIGQVSTVIDANGAPVCTNFGGTSDCALTGPTPYRVITTGTSANAGDYSLRLNQAGTVTGCGTVTLSQFGSAPTAAGSLSTAGATACFQFTAATNAPQLVRVTVGDAGSTPRWDLFNASGLLLCTNYSDQATCSTSGSGPFTIVLSSDDGHEGDFQLGVISVKTASGCITRSDVSYNQTIATGTIAAPGQVNCYQFGGAAADVFSLVLTSVSQSNSFRGVVFDANGAQICSATGDCTLSGPAPYRLVVSGYDDTAGDYRFSLVKKNAPSGCSSLAITPFGATPPTVQLADGMSLRCFSLTTANFALFESLLMMPTGTASGRWDLSKPNGDTICTGYSGQYNECQLPAPGTYSIVLSSSDGGAFAFSWLPVRKDEGTCTPTPPLAFDSDPLLASTTGNGQVVCFSFPAAASDVVRARVTSLSQGTSYHSVLINAAGVRVCDFEASLDRCVLFGSGPYRLLVFPSTPDEPAGNFELRAWQLNDPAGCFGVQSAAYGFGPVERSLQRARDEQCYTFPGAVGDRFSFTAANLDQDQSYPYLEIVDPAGNTVCSGYQNLNDCVLTSTGTHALLLGSAFSDSVQGHYRLTAVCGNPACGSETFTVAGSTPRSVGQSNGVTLELQGRVLSVGDTIKLTRTGSTTITGTPLSVSDDRRTMKVKFDLAAAAIGSWNLDATGASGGHVVLAGAVTVAGIIAPKVTVELIARPNFVPGRVQTITLGYRNVGNIDALAVPIVLSGLPAGTVIVPKFDLAHLTPNGVSSSPLVWDQAKTTYLVDNAVELPLLINRIPGATAGQLQFDITVPSQSNYDLKAAAGDCGSPAATAARAGRLQPAGIFGGALGSCASAAIGIASNFIPGGPCLSLATGQVVSNVQGWVDGSADAPPTVQDVSSFVDTTSTLLQGAACAASFVPGGQVISGVLGALSSAGGWFSSGLGAGKCLDDASKSAMNWVASMDPNEMVGPTGGGTTHAIQGDGMLRYAIYFENQKSASAPAQEVSITDTLDPTKFDLSTLKFADVRWGKSGLVPETPASSLDSVVDLRPAGNLKVRVTATANAATGALAWHLDSIDPDTNALPQDPSVGFLPPNVDGSQGQGVVYFDVALKTPTSGTTITNKASIVFDLNQPILTNEWTNLIDRDKPTSKAAAVTPTGSTFPVTWTGADAPSGIAGYDIYVATDDGDYALWLARTTETGASYPGQGGHKYSITSIAVDLAGNVEGFPPSPDVTVNTPGSTAAGAFKSLAPSRVLDTRSNVGAPGPVGALGTVSLQVTGAGGVPSTGVAAVVLNVTAVAPSGGGYLTLYPSNIGRPDASNLNFVKGQTIPNLVVVPVGTDGKVKIFNGSGGTVQILADVAGYYLAGAPTVPGAFKSLAPSRVLDTRSNVGAPGPVGALGTVSLQVTGAGGVPSTGVAAVVLNVTAVAPSGGGYLTLYPSNIGRPDASNLNFVKGQTIPNLVVVPVGTDGKVKIFNGSGGTVQILADVAGYYLAGAPTVPGAFKSLAPSRVLDTRSNVGAPGPVGALGTVSLQVTGAGGVPSTGVAAVVLNVTAVAPSGGGYLTLYPSNIGRPDASNLNFVKGQTIPNLVVVPVGTDGKVKIFNGSGGTVQIIADVAGYYRS